MMTNLMTNDVPASFTLRNAQTGTECHLALQDLWLTGRILPVGARLMVRHTFRSAEKNPLEMIYSFIMPRDASLRRFRVTGEGFSVRSELQLVAEAQRLYEEGIDRGNLSTMARVYGDGMVNLSVGNIAPGEAVTVWLELAAGVESRDDGLRFRFPFTLAPTYHRQARASENDEGQGEMELPEEVFGDLILPAWERDGAKLHRVGFHLDIDLHGAIGEVSSPSHPLRVKLGKTGLARVLLGTSSDQPNRDLVLDVRGAAAACARVFGGLDEMGKARVAALIPSSAFGERPTGTRRIVFLLDRSGSMEGAPIDQARRALAACLPVLDPADEFAMVAFDHNIETFRDGLSDGSSESRQAARDFLAGIDACGGTELLAGIEEGVRLLGGKGGEILLLTDGQVAETESIIKIARQAGARIHCLGIGNASQDRFLAQLARETGGVSRFLTPRERVDMAALELFAALGRPVAEKVHFELDGLPGGRIEPQPPESVYSGTPLMVFAQANTAGEGRLVATWESGGAAQRREFPVVMEGGRLGETLKLLQGARLITDAQLETGAAGTARGKLVKRQQERETRRLEQLRAEYGLASRAMALVAVLERPADQPGKLPETRIVAVGMPGDTVFEAYFQARDVRFPVTVCACKYAPGDVNTVSNRLPANVNGEENCFFEQIRFQRIRNLEFIAEPAIPRHPLTPEDTLMELAGLMEPDGGMPGKDPQERVLHTMAALLCFMGQNSASVSGPFARHLKLMVKFLVIASQHDLGDEFDPIRQRILATARDGHSISGDWIKLARRLIIDRKVGAEKAWKEIVKQVKAVQP